jgi:hypothetical protein
MKVRHEIYNDAFAIKNLSINIIRQMSKTINYDNQKEVIEILPILQKQMDIIDVANNKLMQIYQNINNRKTEAISNIVNGKSYTDIFCDKMNIE